MAWQAQRHPGGSVAYRLDWPSGKRLVYATDTSGDLSDAHAAWSRGADLLMHEGMHFRDQASQWALKTGHSWTSRVAEVAAAAQPGKLLLTHINPLDLSDDPIDRDTIQAKVESEVIVASSHGLQVDF